MRASSAANPAAAVKVRDLGAQPIPYFDGNTAGALFTPADARTVEQHRIVEMGDTLIAELMEADRIVFAVPIYNFNLPAQFKSYLDHVARAGPFRYTSEGVPEGLIKGKQVFVLTARGGKAEGTPSDTLTPYLRQMLGFLGMSDVTFIAAEGMALGEVAVLEGLAQARSSASTRSWPTPRPPAWRRKLAEARRKKAGRGPPLSARAAAFQSLQALDEAGRIPAAAAHLLHVAVELVHQRGQRQAGAVVAGLGQHQPEILAHPVHREAEVEFVVDHGAAAVLHLPALRRALADHVQHQLHVQVGRLAEGDGFGQPLHHAGDANLVDHLGQLAGSRGTDQ